MIISQLIDYLIDIKEVRDAPRITKLFKIMEKFSDGLAEQEQLDSNSSPVYYN